ncbi:hypothetical protein [Bordetella sp. LUAb4]|uniref:hypothetical protein n=1 Tax=Bordetella sp. LUAb4 TaxID=2843195 RepID=UPI001E4A218F|nr:hypothetical protein [Bordetella sp. LUAb4]
MTTFRALVCDIPGSEAKRTAYRVVHDAFCAEVFRELGERLDAWPPASAAALLAAEPAQQPTLLRAWLDDIPNAWRQARAQLCELGGHEPQACRQAGHIAWVLIATLFDKFSAPVLQATLREMPDARLAALYAYGTSHLTMFQYVARYDLQRRLGNAKSGSQAVTREIQECVELGQMPDTGMLRELALSLRRRAALSQVLDGPASPTIAASAAEIISTAQDGTGLTSDLQVLLDVLLVRTGGGSVRVARQDDDDHDDDGHGDRHVDVDVDASIASLVVLADTKVAVHATACYRAARAIALFVDFARSWNAPVFFDSDGQPLRLARLLSIRAARVDDGSGTTAPQIQLTASIGVRGKHPAVSLIIVAQLGEADTVIGLADYAQLRNARPLSDSGKFAAAV